MPATPIAAASRYFPTGTVKYYYCPSIANKAAPSRAELNAGTDLSGEIQGIEGWTITSELLDAPDIATRFMSKISGRLSAPDSSLTFYASTTGTDVRQLLPRDTVGFIVRLDAGDVAGRKMDVYPVKVSGTPKDIGTGDHATIQCQFAVTSEPAENVTIPA